MINIEREEEVPSSLQTQEIRDYIDNIQLHLSDPVNIPKPDAPASYRTSDLLEAFDRCFYSKCYLTEQKFPNSYCLDVEHFISISEDQTLRYEWTNLFPAEHRANKMKPRSTPVGGLLNPCNPAHDVENEIFYSISVEGQRPSFQARNPNNIRARNTAELLERLHNGHDDVTIKATAGLRHEIYKKYHKILDLIIDWLASPENSNLKYQYEMELKLHLSRKSSFTMLSRSIAHVDNHIPRHFLD